ncbi:hypothetical protein L9F63_017285 [Diploptera punctata]|uniref:Uncharacterized protein n=1 Tax=Diploptera punctata TaxID=6984 RepID=A0AAD7ZZH6_DIPPU|nr:hypothetical protein L9F63_017285 [Diploptera punctata]
MQAVRYLVYALCILGVESQLLPDNNLGGSLDNLLIDEPHQQSNIMSPWRDVCAQDCMSILDVLPNDECLVCCNRFIGFSAYACMGIYYHVRTRFAQQQRSGSTD